MSEGELWKNTTVWWNINPEEWSLSLGYHQYLMWGQMGLNCHCKDLTAFYVRWLEKVVCLLWKAFYIGGCVPLAECPPNKDGRMCVSQYVSHPSHQFGLQGGFYLSARWWGGASKAYCAPLLCAAECCLFGLTDPVADVWAHVEWTTKPHSQLAVMTKSYRMWILNIWVTINGFLKSLYFLTVAKYLFNSEAGSAGHFLFVLNSKLKTLSLNDCALYPGFEILYEKYPWLLVNLLHKNY